MESAWFVFSSHPILNLSQVPVGSLSKYNLGSNHLHHCSISILTAIPLVQSITVPQWVTCKTLSDLTTSTPTYLQSVPNTVGIAILLNIWRSYHTCPQNTARATHDIPSKVKPNSLQWPIISLWANFFSYRSHVHSLHCSYLGLSAVPQIHWAAPASGPLN